MNTGKTAVVAAVVLASMGAPAMAAYTSILASGEPSLHAIFTQKYGTLSVANIGALSSASTFTAGAGPSQYTFTRIHDYFGAVNTPSATPTNLHSAYTGTTTDQRFADGIADVAFLVKHAGFTNRLAFSTTAAGTLTDGNTGDIIGSVVNSTAQLTLGADFQFAVKVNGQSNAYYGSNTDTHGGDHFVTWQVTGQGRSFWLVAIEDLNLGDRDYNDWIGEVTMVPLPPAAWVGLSTLAGIGLLGAIRRRRQA